MFDGMTTYLESLLKEMMNQGLLIWSADGKYYLHKIPTPANMNMSISEEIKPNTNIQEFTDYDKALLAAEEIVCSMCPAFGGGAKTREKLQQSRPWSTTPPPKTAGLVIPTLSNL